MLKRTRSQRFADALREWDSFKKKADRLLKDGFITPKEHERMLRNKSKELDL